MALSDALAELDRHLADSGSPLPDFLRPGLPAGRVYEVLADLGLTPPEDVLDLYGWHDGTDTAGYIASGRRGPWLFPFVTFVALERAAASYRDMLEMNVPEYVVWPRRLFPVFDAELTQYGIVCDPGAPDHGQVWVRDLDLPEDEPAFSSLEKFVDEVVRLFASGGYYYDRDVQNIQEAAEGAVFSHELDD